MSLTGISANRLELLQIADAVAREKSIDREIVIEAIEEAIQKGLSNPIAGENSHRDLAPGDNDMSSAWVLDFGPFRFFDGGDVWVEGATADPEDEKARADAERVACA